MPKGRDVDIPKARPETHYGVKHPRDLGHGKITGRDPEPDPKGSDDER